MNSGKRQRACFKGFEITLCDDIYLPGKFYCGAITTLSVCFFTGPSQPSSSGNAFESPTYLGQMAVACLVTVMKGHLTKYSHRNCLMKIAGFIHERIRKYDRC